MIDKLEIQEKFEDIVKKSKVLKNSLLKLSKEEDFPDNLFAIFTQEIRDKIVEKDGMHFAYEIVKFMLLVGEYYKDKEEKTSSMDARLVFTNLSGEEEETNDFTCSNSVFIVDKSRHVEYDGESMVEIKINN